jgi:hypothetical protein
VAAAKPSRITVAHLMCGTPLWGVAGAAGCVYLAYLSYEHVRRQGFNWKHDAWSIVTYSVWVLLLAGLTSATRCWRERMFFGLVLANFVLGFLLTVWASATRDAVRDVRIISGVLWGLAAMVSLAITLAPGRSAGRGKIVK